MAPSGDLKVQLAALALCVVALGLAIHALATRDVAVAQYLASGETPTALRSEFETAYLADCRVTTKHSVLAGPEEATARGIELHCDCALAFFLGQAEVDDVKSVLERGAMTSHGQLVQALARGDCLAELTRD